MKLKNVSLFFVIFIVFIYIFVSKNSFFGHEESNTNSNESVEYEFNDTLPADEYVACVDSLLFHAISDKYALASLVSYPLYRPYPLRTIDSAEQFIAYYDTLIEQEMIDQFRGPQRKWIKKYNDGYYYFEYDGEVDWVVKNVGEMDGVEFQISQIPLSKKEKNLREKYLRRERKSLQGYDDYEVENCIDLEDGTVYRILVYKEVEWCDCPTFYSDWLGSSCQGTKLIALEYAPNQYDKVKTIHKGCSLAEGSCGSVAYLFDDKWFGQWQCANYYVLNLGTTINVFDGEQFIDIPCKRTCWRDYE